MSWGVQAIYLEPNREVVQLSESYWLTYVSLKCAKIWPTFPSSCTALATRDVPILDQRSPTIRTSVTRHGCISPNISAAMSGSCFMDVGQKVASVKDTGKRVGIILRQKWRRVDASQRKIIFSIEKIWFHIQTPVAMSTSLIEYLSCGNCRSVSTIWARCKEVGPRNQVHKWPISSDKKFHCCFSCTVCSSQNRQRMTWLEYLTERRYFLKDTS